MALDMKTVLIASVLGLFSVLPLMAEQASQVTVTEPWARASIGSRPAAVYLALTNTSQAPATLTGLKADAAGHASIHRTSTDANGVSSMAPAGEIILAPGESIKLEPGGLHGMLMQMNAPLKKGTSVDVNLVFSDGTEQPVEIPVLGIAAKGPEG